MPLRIAQIASEAVPFAKTGGLADVTGALTRHLDRAGHDVRLFMPLYATLDTAGQELVPISFLQDVPLAMGPWPLRFSAYAADLPGSGAPVTFVHCPELYGRSSLYTGEWDEPIRFGFLAQAALVCCQHMGWAPEIVHVHDWHTALVPLYLKTRFAWDGLFAGSRTVLTLHNLAFQGMTGRWAVEPLNLSGHEGLLHREHLAADRVNLLETGLLYADAITTVSRTYAEEIQTPEHGFGLDGLLRQRRSSLFGIVNGIDTEEWSPRSDAHLPARYDADDLAGKRTCKEALLARLGLDGDLERPLFGVVSRLTAQKGFDLMFDVVPAAVAHRGARLAVVGTGERRYAELFHWLARTFPGRVAFHEGYSDELAHLVEAGADAFLMPSRFEPCGLNQMYSQAYGTPPIVRRTGGLADTVEPWDPAQDRGTGFVFEHFDPPGFGWAVNLALDVWYTDREGWRRMMRRGMTRDFSWKRQGGLYVELYRRLLGR